ncbi:MAG: ABC transporter ATP-binding protein/permease [Lachnospiraceae bacterium]|nr:ABC transporter ATP-binding protein/permease [Lachnospiraceae bacterium]
MSDILHKLSYIFDRKQKRNVVLLLFAIFLGAVLELLGVSLIMPLVQIISDPAAGSENPVIKQIYSVFGLHNSKDLFLFLASVIILIYFLKNIYLMVMYYAQYRYIYNNQLSIAGRLIDCYLKKPYTYHLDNNSSNMIRNIMLDTERLFQLILQFLNVISEGLLSLLLGLYLLLSDPVMTVTLVILLGLCMGLYQLLTRKRVKGYGEINQKYDGKMHQAIGQALGAVKDIKILHREKYFVNAFVEYGRKKMNSLINMNFFGVVPRYLIETVCVAGILMVMMAKVKSGADLGQIIPQLAAFAVAAFKLLPSVGKISNYLNGISFLRPSIDLIYRDLKETEDMVGVESADRSENVLEKENASSIRIDEVTYSYPNTRTPVLKNASFEIPLGASVGLIGPTGAGKTTMADLILGILFPQSGKILYGKESVHDYPFAWAKKLSYIPQAIFLADESIRENVAFGIDRDKIDDKAVWAALTEAQLSDFVKTLPDGLDTEVGERGVRLSGGQRQRIGIARALYSDPEILVLDEATSALDSDTEKAVMDAIERLHGKKTLLIIAHRLSTIDKCEYIFKVENRLVNPLSREEFEALKAGGSEHG